MAGRKKSDYSELLKDPRWQKLRLEVFQRDDWTCQDCRSKKNTLNVHHKRYEKGRKPWEYPIEQLSTLCQECHDLEYEFRYPMETELVNSLRDAGFHFHEIEELARGIDDLRRETMAEGKGNIPYEIRQLPWYLLVDPDSRKEVEESFFRSLPGNTT